MKVMRAFQTLDRAIMRRALRRPGRTMRLFALSGLLFSIYGLTEARGWHDVLWGVSVCLLLSVIVFAPRGLYDGSWGPWMARHQALSGAVGMVFLSAAGFLAVSGVVEDWKFGLFVMLGIGCLTAVRLISDREQR